MWIMWEIIFRWNRTQNPYFKQTRGSGLAMYNLSCQGSKPADSSRTHETFSSDKFGQETWMFGMRPKVWQTILSDPAFEKAQWRNSISMQILRKEISPEPFQIPQVGALQESPERRRVGNQTWRDEDKMRTLRFSFWQQKHLKASHTLTPGQPCGHYEKPSTVH